MTPESNDSLPGIPDPIVVETTRWAPSLVWAVPILAALIGLSLIVTMVLERGSIITLPDSGGARGRKNQAEV